MSSVASASLVVSELWGGLHLCRSFGGVSGGVARLRYVARQGLLAIRGGGVARGWQKGEAAASSEEIDAEIGKFVKFLLGEAI